MAIPNWLKEWAVPLSAGATLVLAIAAFWAIRENQRVRKEEKERESWRRRLEELQHWINEVVTVKSECARPTGNPEEWRQREAKARIVVANKEYVRMEAERVDSKFATEIKLVNNIKRLSFIIEKYTGASLSGEEHQREIEDLCAKSLTKISIAKAELQL